MYKLYGVKSWGSLAPQCVLAELNIPHEMVWLSPEDRRGPYRQINPLGYVPSLALPDGRLVHESSAIVIHLTDAHASDLAPRPGTPDHALYLSWMTWLNAEIYSTMNAAEFLESESNKIGDATSRAALALAVRAKVDGLFDIVERHLGDSGGFMLGKQQSAAVDHAQPPRALCTLPAHRPGGRCGERTAGNGTGAGRERTLTAVRYPGSRAASPRDPACDRAC